MRRAALVALLLFLTAIGAWVSVGAGDDRPVDRSASTEPAPASESVRRHADLAREPAPNSELPDAPEVLRVITGDVTAHDAPVEGAEVTLHRSDASARPSRVVGAPEIDLSAPVASALTTADGTFEIQTSVSGPLAAIGRKAGYAPDIDAVEDDLVFLSLDAAVQHEARVVDAEGSPIEGAEIANDQFGFSPNFPAATTDANGRAAWFGEENAAIVVSAPGFVTEGASLRGREPGGPPVIIALEESLQIAGSVVDADHAPVAEALVELFDWGALRATVRTGEDGAFVFDGLSASEKTWAWSILATHDDHTRQGDVVRPGQTDVRLVMGTAVTIRGTVTYVDGTPPDPERTWGVEIDEHGRFETHVDVGRSQVVAGAPAPHDGRVLLEGITWVDAAAGESLEDVRVVLAASTWTSYVSVLVAHADGRPAAEVRVGAWVEGVSVADETRTGDDGRALLEISRPPGTPVHIAAEWGDGATNGDAWSDGTVATGSGLPEDVVELTLREPAVLRVRLAGPDGLEIPFQPSFVSAGSLRFASDGTSGVRAGSGVTLHVDAPGYAEKSVRLKPPYPERREVVVELEPLGRVIGRLVTNDGSPASASVLPWTVGEDRRWGSSTGIHPDSEGRFEITLLPVGPARITGNGIDVYFDVEAEGVTDLGDVTVGEWIPFAGVVEDGDRRPIGGATICADNRDGLTKDGPACTGEDGRFEAHTSLDFALWTIVRRHGYATRILPPGTPLEQRGRITLERGGSLRVPESHLPQPGGWFGVEVKGPGATADGGDWWWTVDEEGGQPDGVVGPEAATLFHGIPAGTQRVRLYWRGGRTVRTLEFRPGETTTWPPE